MKKTGLFLILLLSSFVTFAQLGKSKQEMVAQIGKERVLKESSAKPGYAGVLFMLDSISFLQATFRGETAVMLNYMRMDSLLSEQQYNDYLSLSLPGFSPLKKCTLANKTYLLDTRKNQLVVQSHKSEGGPFPLIGVIMVSDPTIISSMSERIKQFCE